ncbi:MAG: tail fiber domain-containing protein [Candidatus Pacebacteria bacterium]|nr:tail fiber domain-containing protein [Candidatus Paceibacterota bacterium]
MKQLTTSIKLFVLGFVLVFGGSYVFAEWTDAPATPPSNNAPTPLNATATDQTKTGKLTAGGLNVSTGKTYQYDGVDIIKGKSSTGSFFFGKDAGNVTVTGSSNIGVGQESLKAVTSGGTNSALGYRTLFANTTGSENTALGGFALYFNTSGSTNVGIGSASLYTNTTGSNNTAIGTTSLHKNTSGADNTAVGRESLYSNTIGEENVGLGSFSLRANTTGFANTALGVHALRSNTTAVGNTAVGNGALYFNTSGGPNTAVGTSALSQNTTGGNNVAIGVSALSQNISGSHNTGIGDSALLSNQMGANNVAVGENALRQNKNSNNTAIGVGALSQNSVGATSITPANNTAVGYNALVSTTTGSNNTAIGAGANVGQGLPGSGSPSAFSNATAIGAGAIARGNNYVALGNDDVTKVITTGAITSARNIVASQGFDCPGQIASCYRASSDFRLKKDIKEDNLGLDFIMKLKPVTFKYKKGAGNTLNGLIAQDVEQALKELNINFSGLVRPSPISEYYSLDYSNFVVPLINAVQEQQKEIDELKAKNANFEARLKALEEKLR